MGRRVILLWCFLCGWLQLSAQEVRVINSNTFAAVEFATIQSTDSNRGAVTNADGRADISSLVNESQLIFSHPSYVSVTLTWEQLRQSNFLVRMQERIIRMDEVVISANKWEQNKREIPNEISEINAEEIAKADPLTTADALALTGQVFVQKSQLGGGSPIIRGFAANSVLIIVDGVRMNNAIFRSGNLQNVISLDANVLEGAEVVFGPGSVIYGSDALGGVMDFHTKEPQLLTDLKANKVRGSAFTRFGTAAQENTGHFQFHYAAPRFGSFTAITYSKFGDLTVGSNRTDDFPNFGKRPDYVARVEGVDRIVQNENPNEQIGSGYNQFNLLQKFKWRLSSNTDLNYTAHWTTSSDIPRFDRLIERRNDQLRFAEWNYGPQEWQMHAFKLSFYKPTKFFSEAKLTTSYQRMKESRHTRLFQNDVRTNRTEKVDVFAFNADFDKEFNENQQLFYGLEVFSNDVASSAFSENIQTNATAPASTRYPDGGSQMNSLAVYGSYKSKLSPELIFSAGARYSYVQLESKFNDRRFFNFPFDEINLSNGALNGSLGLVYLPNKDTKYSLLLSSGFRAPNVDDVGKVFDSEPGNVVVPNPNLKPEFSYNVEIGFTRKLNESVKLEFVAWYSELRDALVRQNFQFNGQDSILFDGILSRVQAEVNAGEAYVAGFSTTLTADFGSGFSFDGTITYTDGEDRVNRQPLRHVTPIFGRAGVTYNQPLYSLELYSRFSGGLDFDELAPSEQNKTHLYTTDGALPWATLNLRSSFNINSALKVNLQLENLLDTHYRPYSSGISAPGLNAVISLRYSF